MTTLQKDTTLHRIISEIWLCEYYSYINEIAACYSQTFFKF
jgi:hypothetical protein